MSCLFCDQTPETVNAREKLAEIARILGCTLGQVVSTIHLLKLKHDTHEMDIASIMRDRNTWMNEARAARLRAQDLERAYYHGSRRQTIIAPVWDTTRGTTTRKL